MDQITRLLQRGVMILGLAVLGSTAARAQAVDAPAPEAASARTAKEAVTASRFMVATANPIATRAGYDVLDRGGNAIDAMIAVQLALNLVEPQSSGLGGGAFLLYWDAAARKLVTVDGREKAPMAAKPDLFLKADGTPMTFWEAVIGGRSVGVPGTLALLQHAHRAWGSLPWEELFEEAAQRADRGFEISPRLAEAIAAAKEEGLARFEPARSYFFTPEGEPRAAGETLTNPDLADTLRFVGTEGAKAFYEGPIAKDIVATVTGAENAGAMTEDDLAAYEVVEREPVCIFYRAYEVCGMGPPSSGGIAVAQILGLLENFDLTSRPATADGAHLFLEASRLAFADRDRYVADSDFARVPVEGLLDEGYLERRAQLISLEQAMGKAEAGDPPHREGLLFAPDASQERPGTSHIVIRDGHGNAVSMTTTIETGFGSRLMTHGFLLNNELTDFSFVPEAEGRPVANRVEPGKRPRSSMAPTIVFAEGREPYMLLGSPGGSRIIGYVAKTLIAHLDWHMDPQAAIDLGNMINRNGDSELEAGTSVAALAKALEAKGHTVKIQEEASGVQAIVIEGDRLKGGADPRREGIVMGR
jgi:gamma-glutamyltranspeptidase/glutathione hydrolase